MSPSQREKFVNVLIKCVYYKMCFSNKLYASQNSEFDCNKPEKDPMEDAKLIKTEANTVKDRELLCCTIH